MKPREWWIDFFCGEVLEEVKDGQPLKFARETSDVRVVEADAYDELKKENEALKARIAKQNAKVECADCGSLLARF